MNNEPRVNPSKQPSRSPNSLHRFAQDFGDTRSTSWAYHSYDLLHQNLLNQEESKDFHQIEHLFPRICEGSQGKNHEGFMHTSPTKSPRERPQIHPRKSPRKGSKNHKKGKMGETTSSLEEPCQIIYRYHEGSYKV
jgi:hypothetical protein